MLCSIVFFLYVKTRRFFKRQTQTCSKCSRKCSRFLIITDPKWRLYFQKCLSVCLPPRGSASTQRGSASTQTGSASSQRGSTSTGICLQPVLTSSGSYCSSQYAPYWNAFSQGVCIWRVCLWGVYLQMAWSAQPTHPSTDIKWRPLQPHTHPTGMHSCKYPFTG